jgi:negative regulator of flagellin synthesis FlgM
MKITGDKSYLIQPYVKKTAEEERVEGGKKSKKPSSKTDRVEISKEGREKKLQEIKGLLEKVPDVREEKVTAVRTAIEDGTYRVKGKEIAKKMIKESIDEFV